MNLVVELNECHYKSYTNLSSSSSSVAMAVMVAAAGAEAAAIAMIRFYFPSLLFVWYRLTVHMLRSHRTTLAMVWWFFEFSFAHSLTHSSISPSAAEFSFLQQEKSLLHSRTFSPFFVFGREKERKLLPSALFHMRVFRCSNGNFHSWNQSSDILFYNPHVCTYRTRAPVHSYKWHIHTHTRANATRTENIPMLLPSPQNNNGLVIVVCIWRHHGMVTKSRWKSIN